MNVDLLERSHRLVSKGLSDTIASDLVATFKLLMATYNADNSKGHRGELIAAYSQTLDVIERLVNAKPVRKLRARKEKVA